MQRRLDGGIGAISQRLLCRSKSRFEGADCLGVKRLARLEGEPIWSR
jgi:hypothetical protein